MSENEPNETNRDGPPSGESAAVGSHQQWCSRPAVPAGADRCLECGCVQPGNRLARGAGVHAYKDRGEVSLPVDLRDDLAVFRSGVETDQGGVSELTTIGAGYVRRLVEVEAVVRLLGADLQARGLFTKRGRVRSTYNAFLLAVDRWDRLAQRLGLERRQKPVDPLDAVRAAVVEANRR